MKTKTYKSTARAPNNEEVPVLDAIAFEILENLVLEGKLAQLTNENEKHHVEHYQLRKPSTE